MRVALAGGVLRPYGPAVPLTRKLKQMVDDLSVIDDPQERLALLVDRARKLPGLPADARIDAHRVTGCVSLVWLVGEVRDGRCFYRCEAESPIVRGLVAFLCEFYSGFTPAEILAVDPDPLEPLGITRNLSPTRRNGLAAARRTIREFAAKYNSPAPATKEHPV
ncbi:SufE family protein [Opitutus sp. ER46]|uniref:SufE family protein n=1 Tax=Opitutus sp. ER46 TaxID=2161864 RepID=UPI000D315BF2|nr:SufE family protein [Opitutus sp. ER46]PTX97856.1 Fe-S metabolism protein SufE [Opitutus sp. ER46]